MTLPTLSVEFGFTLGASTSTYLHLDDTTRGLLDTGTLAPDDVFEDVTDYVRAVTITRGSTRVDGPVIRYEAGTATVTLVDSDRRFDPTNLDGPYVAAGITQVKPMVAVRIRATWSGTTYNLWRGFVDSWQLSYDPSGQALTTTVVTCTDAFKFLSNYDRVAVAAVGAGEDSGARVSRILNSVGWSATDRVIATGDHTLQATTMDGTALTELYLVTDSEMGEFYIDGAGRTVFRNRLATTTDARSVTPQATFGDSGSELRYESVEIEYDEEQLINLARVARTGGSQQTAQDTDSQDDYLIHTFERTDLLLQTDGVALDYAERIVAFSAEPELRFSSIVVNPQRHDQESSLWPQALGREIGDKLTIRRRPPGGGDVIERDVFIRGISHDTSAADSSWTTTWVLQSATKFSGLVLDHATLGKLDQNALAY